MKLSHIRKKQLIIIAIGLIVAFIFYFAIPQIQKFRLMKYSKNIQPSTTSGKEANVFENISFIGYDSSGKQYNVKAKIASIDKDHQELVHLTGVESDYSLKDGTVLKITSLSGLFNKTSSDILYEQEVKIFKDEGKITSDRAQYLVKEKKIYISGHVVGDYQENNLKKQATNNKKTSSHFYADKITIDTESKTSEIIMNDNSKQVTGVLEYNKIDDKKKPSTTVNPSK